MSIFKDNLYSIPKTLKQDLLFYSVGFVTSIILMPPSASATQAIEPET
jgi:hypothetical protein